MKIKSLNRSKKMSIRVSDLTIEEFKDLISKTVQETIEDYLEALKALASKDYLNSIREARGEYKAGDYKDYNQVF
jgi:hypothetical protein